MAFNVGEGIHVSELYDDNDDICRLAIRTESGSVIYVLAEDAHRMAVGMIGMLGRPLQLSRLEPLAKLGDGDRFTATVNGAVVGLEVRAPAASTLRAHYGRPVTEFLPDPRVGQLEADLRAAYEQVRQLTAVLGRTTELCWLLAGEDR